MSFLLHRDTCVACLRGIQKVRSRCLQNRGNLHVSALTVAELEIWLARPLTPARYRQSYAALMQAVRVVDVNVAIAQRTATVAAQLHAQGLQMTTANLLIAATALVHGFTLVTQSSSCFHHTPGLAVVDWTNP
jgi:tRNA(fMet)-specific endonuclease VapC